mmetsp:Transcript_35648/g.39744  ORF Transcript_35648/g.39744 Transcript_35648/m.39744 type:complete len:97 (+) Transcript_35648:375-665(+)
MSVLCRESFGGEAVVAILSPCEEGLLLLLDDDETDGSVFAMTSELSEGTDDGVDVVAPLEEEEEEEVQRLVNVAASIHQNFFYQLRHKLCCLLYSK